MSLPADWIVVDWAVGGVGAAMTTRAGPDLDAAAIGASPVFLRQVHGARVVTLAAEDAVFGAAVHEADAAVTATPGLACVVRVADCLPVLVAAPGGRAVGAAHAGWRGLAAGVVEATVERVAALAQCPAGELSAWLGPCIGPDAFEVGRDVFTAFGADRDERVARRFIRHTPNGARDRDASGAGSRDARGADDRDAYGARDRDRRDDKWFADLAGLARDRLGALGVHRVSGGRWCTVGDASRFFSFRRDGSIGRMAAAVWIEARPADG